MEKRTRTIIFIACVFLFIMAAPSVILYSQGYRFDFETKKIVQTGALYLKAMPRSAEVYLNGKYKTKTSMLTGSILIENLLPKNYQIEIKKEGYAAWQKNLPIKESQVSEAKNVVLFPENFNFLPFIQKTKSFAEIIADVEQSATSSDKQKVIEAGDYEISILFLNDEERVFLTRFSEKIGRIFWLNDDYLIFNVGNKIKIAEIDDRDKIQTWEIGSFPDPKIFFNNTDKKLYILSEGNFLSSENLLK